MKNNYKFILCILLVLANYCVSYAQTIERDLISVMGGVQLENPYMAYTVGEAIIGKGNNLLTQELTHGQQQGIADGSVAVVNKFVESIRIFPNPNQGVFCMDGIQHLAGLEIIVSDVHGRLIKKVGEMPSDCSIDVSDITTGVYLVVIKDKSEIKYVEKLIIID